MDRYERLWRPVAEERQRAALVPSPLPHGAARSPRHAGVSRVPGFDRVVARSVAGKHTALVTHLQRRAGSASRARV